jgi:sugar phosphate isomerase/epimerase
VEPRRRRRPGGAVRPQPLRRQAGLVLTQVSLPTLNWIGFPELTPTWPLEDVLEGASRAGFRAVGLDDLTVGARSPDEVASLLRAHGLACTDVGVLRVGESDIRVQAEWLAALASATGASTCIAALYTRTTDDALDDLRTGTAILADAGVRTALEFAAYGGLRTLADAIDICGTVGWEQCGLLIDTWHFFRGGAPWELLRSLDRDQIVLVHINDAAEPKGNDVVYESRFRRTPLGAGTFPLAAFADALDRIGYEGVVSIEVLSAALRRKPPAEGARVLLESLDALRSVRHVV